MEESRREERKKDMEKRRMMGEWDWQIENEGEGKGG